MPDEIGQHQAETGHQAIYLIPPSKMAKFNPQVGTFGHNDYIGFLEPDKHPKSLCMPCCFKKPKQNKAYYNSCVNNQCLGNNTEIQTETESSTNPLYVFNKDKRFIIKDRYAFLPTDLELIFNTSRPGMNCETYNGNIRNGMHFNCYLRKGLSSQSSDVKNAFINAIGAAKNGERLEGDKLREKLADFITPELFGTLLNGNLKIIFSDEAGETDPYSNFIEYLLNDYIDEDYLWDFVTAPGVISDDGFNLIIFEALLNPNRSIKNIMLKCPLGFDTDQLFNMDKQSLVLFKYSRGQGQYHYEPIYHVFDQAGKLYEEKVFPAYNDYIDKILELYNECKPQDNAEVIKNLDEFYKKSNIPDIPFEPALTAKATIDILHTISQSNEYINSQLGNVMKSDIEVKAQIVDSMNKVSHVLLGSGVKLPVKPSVIDLASDIPIREYYSSEDIEELEKA